MGPVHWAPTQQGQNVQHCDSGQQNRPVWGAPIGAGIDATSENLREGTMTMPIAPTPTRAGPVQMDLDAPLNVARWRAIGNPIMVTPHIIVIHILSAMLGVITFIA
jgi:hypothetical protein